MSMIDVLTVPVSGGKAEAERLWPEGIAMGSWSDVGEPTRWADMWTQRNNRPHDIWVTQGVGEGLPILVPLAKDPRGDRFLMDQLVDTGSRTVEGTAAMNGEMIHKMGVPNPGMGPLLPFETAYQNLKELMDGLRAKPEVKFNHEKTMDKLKDDFSIFKDKKGSQKGNPHEDPDDGVDFSVPDDDEPVKPPETEVQGEAPEYEDMIDGPLPAKGLGAGPKYLGKPRFPWGAIRAPPTPLSIGLEGKDGLSHRYSFNGGQFTTVTRVVAATAERNPKVMSRTCWKRCHQRSP